MLLQPAVTSGVVETPDVISMVQPRTPRPEERFLLAVLYRFPDPPLLGPPVLKSPGLPLEDLKPPVFGLDDFTPPGLVPALKPPGFHLP